MIGDLKLSKELKEKLLGSDWERLRIGLGIRIADPIIRSYQFWRLIADLNLTPCISKTVRDIGD